MKEIWFANEEILEGGTKKKKSNESDSSEKVNNVTDVSTPAAMDVSKQAVEFPSLGFFLGKRVAYPVVANHVRNTCGKYGLVKSMLNSSIGLFSFQFSSMGGLNAILENGPWSSYAKAMIKLRANVELKDTILIVMPKLTREGFYTCTVRVEYEWKPHRCACCKPTKEVSNSNPFDVLNSVENDGELGTNGGTSNLASNGANSSGSSFWNVEINSTSTTPIVDKTRKLEKLIIEDEVESVDNDMARSMASESISFGTKSLLEQWRDTYENGDYNEDLYDNDMYEGQDFPDKIQDICDNLKYKY
ncbi:hypothetical protein Tco_1202000 [Tanacetum coccineum]